MTEKKSKAKKQLVPQDTKSRIEALKKKQEIIAAKIAHMEALEAK